MNEPKYGRTKGVEKRWERTVGGYYVFYEDGKYTALITPSSPVAGLWVLERRADTKDETLTYVGVYPTLKQAKEALAKTLIVGEEK